MFTLAFISIFMSGVIGTFIALQFKDPIQLSRINFIVLMLTLVSNLVIWIFGFVTYSYAEDMREEAEKYGELLQNAKERLEGAGVTLEKIQEFEPLIDELGEVTDRVDPEKLGKLMEEGLDLLEEYYELKNGESSKSSVSEDEILEEANFEEE